MAIQNILGLFSPRKSAETNEALKQLKSAVYRGTIDNGLGKCEAAAIDSISTILRNKPELIQDAVALIKARIKDRCLSTSLISLDVLDQCMRATGLDFQLYVTKKVLSRVLKLSIPHKGIHPQVQRKAAGLIIEWGSRYGTDPSLADYVRAAKDLEQKIGDICSPARTPTATPRKELQARPANGVQRPNSWPSASKPEAAAIVASARRRSCPDLSSLSGMEIAELAKMSQRKIVEQMQATADPEKLRTLQALHDQLSDDLAVFYANKAAADAEDAAAVAAAAAAGPLTDRRG